MLEGTHEEGEDSSFQIDKIITLTANIVRYSVESFVHSYWLVALLASLYCIVCAIVVEKTEW